MKYSESFYLNLLGFLKNKFPTFYWGENHRGYYWGYKDDILVSGLQTLEQLVDNILTCLKIDYLC